MKKSYPRTAILIFPFASGALYSWSVKPATLISAVVTSTIIIGGGIPDNIEWPENVTVIDINIRLHYLRQVKPIIWSIILWVSKAVIAQFLFAYQVYKLRNQIDVIYCLMGMYYQLPILVARILGKKVMSASMGIYSLKANISYGQVIGTVIRLLTQLNFALSHLVIVESLLLSKYPDLKWCKTKLMNGALYLQDPDRFSSQVNLVDREPIVAFVGRLVKEKGIMDFIEAIPLILTRNPDLKILIVGTGILDDRVCKEIQGKGWSRQVTWIRWIEPNRMPEILNKIRLLVVPSYEEGLPNIILEAMGCGTPVLASKAGGIPDLVEEGQTGLVLETTDAVTIARGVDRAVNSPCLGYITANAKKMIEQEYSLNASIDRYKAILDQIRD